MERDSVPGNDNRTIEYVKYGKFLFDEFKPIEGMTSFVDALLQTHDPIDQIDTIESMMTSFYSFIDRYIQQTITELNPGDPSYFKAQRLRFAIYQSFNDFDGCALIQNEINSATEQFANSGQVENLWYSLLTTGQPLVEPLFVKLFGKLLISSLTSKLDDKYSLITTLLHQLQMVHYKFQHDFSRLSVIQNYDDCQKIYQYSELLQTDVYSSIGTIQCIIKDFTEKENELPDDIRIALKSTSSWNGW